MGMGHAYIRLLLSISKYKAVHLVPLAVEFYGDN